MPINLHDIYRKVYFRYKRAATKFVYTQVNAEFMHDAAKEILAKCTLKSVKDFESKENIYLTCPGIRSTTKPIAGEFYAAIQSKNFYVKGVQLNTHRNGKIVTDGLVYFLKSSDKPGQIKIGYTEQDIDKRINQIRRKQPFSDIVMHFYISTELFFSSMWKYKSTSTLCISLC